MISGTVSGRYGRTLSGQTVEAFLISLGQAKPLVAGLNCALGPDEMEPFIEDFARVAPFYIGAYPNAGLPDPLSPTGFLKLQRHLSPSLRNGRKTDGSILWVAVAVRHPNTFGD